MAKKVSTKKKSVSKQKIDVVTMVECIADFYTEEADVDEIKFIYKQHQENVLSKLDDSKIKNIYKKLPSWAKET
jgi:uncharacterized protein YktA (UPF0223 family)